MSLHVNTRIDGSITAEIIYGKEEYDIKVENYNQYCSNPSFSLKEVMDDSKLPDGRYELEITFKKIGDE